MSSEERSLDVDTGQHSYAVMLGERQKWGANE